VPLVILCKENGSSSAKCLANSETLLQLGRDPKRVGAQLGITSVLHTWTRDLRLHAHLHCIVTGGGLHADGNRWLHAREDYLFPEKVLGKLFRGKLLALLASASEALTRNQPLLLARTRPD